MEGGLKSEMQHPTWIALSVDCGLSLFGDTLHKVSEGLNGAAPVEGLAGSVVQQVSNGVQCLLVMDRQIRALGQHLAQQPVGVFAGATLPGAVGVAEVHPDVGGSGQFAMPGHLLALVVGESGDERLVDLERADRAALQMGVVSENGK